MPAPTFPFARGGLTAADHDAIVALTDAGVRSPSRIARRVERHPGTVAWFMAREGLLARLPRATGHRGPYLRNGELVRPFSAAEDALILARREAGDELGAIAAAVEARFGHRRAVRSIKVRLVMLASYETAAEQTAAEQREDA